MVTNSTRPTTGFAIQLFCATRISCVCYNPFMLFLKQRTRQTLNKKISQLNDVIDNVSSRLRHGNNVPAAQIGSDPEVEATM